MKKASLGVVSALVAALTVLLPTQSAHAADVQYPDLVCTLSVSSTSVVGGDEVTVTVTSDVPADLSITFLEETRTAANARELAETFRTPVVNEAQIARVVGSCDGNERSADIQILPQGAVIGDDDAGGAGAGGGQGDSALAGILPNTGGPMLWLLVLGLVLVAAGAAVVVRRRRA